MTINKVIRKGVFVALILLTSVAAAFAFSATFASAQTYLPPTCSLHATSSSNPGAAVTLSWESDYATSATLNPGGGVAVDGSQIVYPSVTTTYALTVYGLGGSGNCQTTVTVGTTLAAPSCWVTLSNYNYGGSYNYNQPATLSWGSNNATSATISPSVGSVGTSGSQTVYPGANQLYTMTVYGAQGQSANCQTSQYYQPAPTNLSCAISANPSTIQNGAASYLSWTSTGGTSAWLSDGLGSVATNGSLAVRPESSRNYTLTVSDYQGRTQTCNTYVTVSGSYPYVSLNQIPYTGFDFGPVGNALYWMALAGFALAAGYLLVYYLPGRRIRMPAFAAAARLPSFGSRTSAERISVPAIFTSAGGGTVSGQRKGTDMPSQPRVVTPVAAPEKETSAPRSTDIASKDSMSFARSENGAPQIVITRN